MDLSTRFLMIVQGALKALAVRAAPDRSLSPIAIVLWGRLHRMAARLDSLLKRYRAGTLKPREPQTEPAAPKPKKPEMFGPPAPRKPDIVPGRHGWLFKVGGVQAPWKGYLEQLLADPEMKEFLEAAPQAWRILRPLCRMLAVEHGINGAALPPPLKPRKPRPPKARQPRKQPEARQKARPPARRFWPPRTPSANWGS